MWKQASLASIITILVAIPALSKPYSFTGRKGVYTTDADRNTYRGCLFSGGCITLGSKYYKPCMNKTEPDACEGFTWKRGEYIYFVYDDNISVSKNGKTIFSDSVPR